MGIASSSCPTLSYPGTRPCSSGNGLSHPVCLPWPRFLDRSMFYGMRPSVPVIALLLGLTQAPKAATQASQPRIYCLAGFTQDIKTSAWTDHFVGFADSGNYCITLNTSDGTFTIHGSGRKGIFEHTYLKSVRDTHDPHRVHSGTERRTEWILTPDSLYGQYTIQGNELELAFEGDTWDWADINTMSISADGKTLTTTFRFDGHVVTRTHTVSISKWRAVNP